MKVFTDGSCINNGKPNAIAGIGIYFGELDTRNVSSRIDGKQTNNTAELTAVIRVFDILRKEIECNINYKRALTYYKKCKWKEARKEYKDFIKKNLMLN